MIVAALAAALLSAAPVQVSETPAGFGETLFMAGVCGVFGWEGDRSQEGPLFAAYGAAHPELGADEIRAQAFEGAMALRARFESDLAAVRTAADLDAWTSAVAARCDAIAATWPTLLKRTPGTPEAWAETKRRLAERHVPAS